MHRLRYGQKRPVDDLGYQDFLSKHRSCLKETLYNYALNQVQDLLRQQCYVLEGVVCSSSSLTWHRSLEWRSKSSYLLDCSAWRFTVNTKTFICIPFNPNSTILCFVWHTSPTMKTFPYLIETNTYHQAMTKAEEIYNKFNGLYDPRDLTVSPCRS